MDEMNNVNTEQPQKAEGQTGERLFTQAEVDKIIKERLSRVRSATAPKEPTEAEIKDRELTARENRLSCREYLLTQGYPTELLDVIDTSNVKEFQKKADTVRGLLRASRGSAPLFKPEPMRSTEPPFSSGKGFDTAKHKPRQFP